MPAAGGANPAPHATAGTRGLKPKDLVAAMKEDALRKLYGGVPAEPAAYIDPDGDRRWFALPT